MLESQRAAGPSAEKFPRKIRVASTDGAGAIGLVEQAMLESRPHWHLIHFLCVVHVVSRIMTRVTDMVGDFRSLMVRTVLSVRKSDLMSKLRAGACWAIRKMNIVVVQRVQLDEAARKFKDL